MSQQGGAMALLGSRGRGSEVQEGAIRGMHVAGRSIGPAVNARSRPRFVLCHDLSKCHPEAPRTAVIGRAGLRGATAWNPG